MTEFCDFHQKKHNASQWRSVFRDGRSIWNCVEAYGRSLFAPSVYGKKEQRVNHWKEIKSRVRSSDGELLTGTRATQYRKRYLGDTSTQPVDFSHPEYQKELAKTA